MNVLCIRPASPIPAKQNKNNLGAATLLKTLCCVDSYLRHLNCSWPVLRPGLQALQNDSSKRLGSPSAGGWSCSFAIKTPSGQLVLVYISSSTQPSAQMLLVAVWLSHLLPRSSGALHYKILTPSCIFLEYWVSEPAAMHGGAWILLQKRFVTALSEHMSAS